MTVEVTGPPLAVATCARRLAPLGADVAAVAADAHGQHARAALDVGGRDAGEPDVVVDLSWYGPAKLAPRPGSEAVVQALSGLMHVHGYDAGGPRRLGLEVASVAAGVLAAHGVVATLASGGRGDGSPQQVATSVLQAALTLQTHRVAADSSGQVWTPALEGPAPGPPFRSADGHWIEIETLDPGAWQAFWQRLGGGDLELEWAWRLFRPRYFRGTCTLPAGLHETMAAHPLADLATAAEACGVSLSPVRGYDDVLADPGWIWGHPGIEALPRPERSPAGGPPAAGAGGPAPVASDGDPAPRSSAGPLAGLTVVESTTRLQGPLPTQLLQQLGAHVTRVEPPGGDPFRTVPPLLDDIGSFYRSVNRGKDAVELDLSDPTGRDELRDLVAGADAFVHNWRPGKATEWQLDADALAALNPQLVFARASGWGQRPQAERLVGTDFLVQAHAAVGAGLRPEDEPPVPSRMLLTDYFGALITTEALLAGLVARRRTGAGQHVEGSLLDGAMALQAHVVDGLVAGDEPGRRRGRPVWGPLDHPVVTADGVLALGVDGGDALRRAARACDLDADAGGGAIVERLAHAPAAEWEARLADAGVACAEVCTDLAGLPADGRLSELFEPLAAGASVPATPWQHGAA